MKVLRSHQNLFAIILIIIMVWCGLSSLNGTADVDYSKSSVDFYYDDGTGHWTLISDNKLFETKENFISSTTLWQGTVGARKAIFVEAQRLGNCKNAYVLYWVRFNGTLEKFDSFNTCHASETAVYSKGDLVYVELDGVKTEIKVQ